MNDKKYNINEVIPKNSVITYEKKNAMKANSILKSNLAR